jgi:hypothetical protein
MDTPLVLNDLMLLAAIFGAMAALVAVIVLSRRFDLAQRRHRYEVDCLVKSLRMLEQQNSLLNQKLNSMLSASQRLAGEVERVARRAATARPATEDESSPPTPPSPGRVIH